jgi:hypothetical protein
VLDRIDYALMQAEAVNHEDQIVALLLAWAGSLLSANLPFPARAALDELVDRDRAVRGEDTYTMVFSQ